MKHIKKTFLNMLSKEEFDDLQKQYSFKQFSKEENAVDFKKTKITENTVTIMQTTKDFYFTGFPHKINGHIYSFPEPDPTLIYFSSAQRFRRQIVITKNKVLANLNLESKIINDDIVEDFYNYYESVCGTVIFLFISLESFMNSLIPPNAVYQRNMKNRTELFNSQQIQETLNFNDKIKTVIPQLISKDYFKQHPLKSKIISQLKDFRDNITHTKNENKVVKNDFIVKKSFSFDFDQAIDSVANYMNYYKPDYIRECDCGNDF